MPKEAWKRVNFGSMELAKFYLGDFSRGDPYDNHSKYKEQPCLVSPPHNKTTTPRWKKPKELKRSTRCFLWQIPKSPFNTPIWQPHHKNNTMGKHNRQPLLTKLREKIILQGRLEDSCNGRKGRENGWKKRNNIGKNEESMLSFCSVILKHVNFTRYLLNGYLFIYCISLSFLFFVLVH